MLTKINAMLSSSDMSNVKLGVTLLESMCPAEYAQLAAAWLPWADIFGLSIADTIARDGLGRIDCSGMRLSRIPALPETVTHLDCSFNQLTALDVSGCTVLTHLDCSANQLTNLDVSGCTALTTLSCYANQLTNLDVSGCKALKTLSCYANQLTNLDTSANTALTHFDWH